MSDPAAPPGWYPDPAGTRGERFWDGRHWHAGTRHPEPVPWPDPRPEVGGGDEDGLDVAAAGAAEPDVAWLRAEEWLDEDGGDEDGADEAAVAVEPGPGEAVATTGTRAVATGPAGVGADAGAEGAAAAPRPWLAVAAGAAALLVLVVASVAILRGGDGAEVTAANTEPGPTTSTRAPTTTSRPTSTTTAPPPTTATTAATTTAPPTTAPVATAPPLPSFGPGVKLVNQEIAPGRYQTPGGPGCRWSRLADLAGVYSSYLGRSSGGAGQVIVEILPTDHAFESESCGTFVRYTPPPSRLVTFGDGTWAVNDQINPGRYQSTGAGECRWQRLADFRGVGASYQGPGSALAEAELRGSALVDILPTDVGFYASGCGTWVRVG